MWEEQRIKTQAVSKPESENSSSENQDTDIEGLQTKVHLDTEPLKQSLCDNPNKTQIMCITLWTSFLVFLYDGMQGSYGGYVYTYAVKSPLRMTSAQGAFLTSVFWVSI